MAKKTKILNIFWILNDLLFKLIFKIIYFTLNFSFIYLVQKCFKFGTWCKLKKSVILTHVSLLEKD